ncbi:MAG: DNA translocase FtsK 4TM domain-containing protein, partial [Patescibacteria group bacterium]
MSRRYRRRSKWFSFWRQPKSRRYRSDDSDGYGLSALRETIDNLDPEVRKGIFIIFLFALAALSVMGLFDLSGSFGQLTDYTLAIGLGNLKWVFPILLGAWIFCLLNEEKYPVRLINYFGVILLLLGLAGIFHLPYESWQSLEVAKAGQGGGYLGALAALPLLRLMNFWGALVVLIAAFLIGLLLALETSIYGIMWPIKLFGWLAAKFKDWHAYQKLKKQERLLSRQSADNYEEEPAEEGAAPESAEPEAESAEAEEEIPGFVRTEIKMGFNQESDLGEAVPAKAKKYGPIDIPIGLLNSKTGKPTPGDIKNNQEIIRKTLSNFGIAAEMGDVNIGPTVTQFTMRPADGVRLARISTLNADLALALAAHPIRIEAPIPGKSLVGIEVPNVQSAKVTMGEVLLSKDFKTRTNNLFVALGKDVSGKPIFGQLDKMPHLLVAGATGSGKSVCINAIIVSLIYQNSPDELKFVLVDPKRVELPMYNGIPYLLTPVITDVKKTVGALKWAITEMERRFELLAKFGNRNIASFNQTHSDKLPYIVIIIDELADLMATAGNDMEAGIVRLAQMARAVGIHLILATQRPSTEVITGLIKANIPARIAFSVASSIDSRTVLDGAGAEKLVGRGDMLYLGPEMSRPKRIQGVFLSDKEISDVVKFIKSHGEAEYDEKLLGVTAAVGGGMGGGFGDSDEPLMDEAIGVIRESGKA